MSISRNSERHLILLLFGGILLIACGNNTKVVTATPASTTLSSPGAQVTVIQSPSTSARNGQGDGPPSAEELKKAATCPECHLVSPAELQEQQAAAKTAIPDTTISLRDANLAKGQAQKYAEAGRRLAERLRSVFTYPLDRSNRGDLEVEATRVAFMKELKDIYSAKMSPYELHNLESEAKAQAMGSVGGTPVDGPLLQDVKVILDGDPYGKQVGNEITIAVQAHLDSKYINEATRSNTPTGLWQWTLSLEGGKITLLKEIAPFAN